MPASFAPLSTKNLKSIKDHRINAKITRPAIRATWKMYRPLWNKTANHYEAVSRSIKEGFVLGIASANTYRRWNRVNERDRVCSASLVASCFTTFMCDLIKILMCYIAHSRFYDALKRCSLIKKYWRDSLQLRPCGSYGSFPSITSYVILKCIGFMSWWWNFDFMGNLSINWNVNLL